MPKDTMATQEAAHYEQVVQQWRDWLHYLRSQQTLLQVRSTGQRSAFEQDDSDVQEQRARSDLQAIPPAQRAIFEQEFEARRQAIQRDLDAARRTAGGRGSSDPDEVTRRTLEALLGEAEGVSTEDARGMVPVNGDTWYSVDIAELLNAPGEASYAVKRKRSNIGSILTGVMMILVVLAAAAYSFWPEQQVATYIYQDVAVNGVVVDRWEPQRVALGEDVSAPVLDLVPAAAFPPPDAAAAYLTDSAWPLEICLPAPQIAELRAVRLISTLDAPDRIYLLSDQRGPVTDLVLTACEDPQIQHYGVVQETPPLAAHEIGQVAELPATAGITVAVQRMVVLGPGSDPTLPQGQARVVVTLVTAAVEHLDWTAQQPRLQTPGGDNLLPTDTRLDAGTVQFHYLIPLPQENQDVLFSLTAGNDQQVRWRTTLQPPPGRDALLRQFLAIEDVSATPVETAQAQTLPVNLRLVVVNHADTPLALLPEDIALTHDGSEVPLPDIEALRTPLAAEEERVINLEVAVPTTGSPLVLTVGVARFAVQVAFG